MKINCCICGPKEVSGYAVLNKTYCGDCFKIIDKLRKAHDAIRLLSRALRNKNG